MMIINFYRDDAWEENKSANLGLWAPKVGKCVVASAHASQISSVLVNQMWPYISKGGERERGDGGEFSTSFEILLL